jgi:hypothetical protein
MPTYRLNVPARDRKVCIEPLQKMLNTNNSSNGIKKESIPCLIRGLIPTMKVRKNCKAISEARVNKLIRAQNLLLRRNHS